MQSDKFLYYKNHILILYTIGISFFCTNAIIFSEGLTVGFTAGALMYLPSIWSGAVCFAIALMNIASGDFIAYIITMGFIFLFSIVIKRLPKNTPIYKIILYTVSYIPALFLFQITFWFQILNYAVCIIAAYISGQIAHNISASKYFSCLFSNYVFNCFILFIIGMSAPAMTFWKFNLYHIMFAITTLCYSKLAEEKDCIFSMVFLAFAGHVAGIEYAMVMLAVSVIPSLFVCKWNKLVSFAVYICSTLVIALFIKSLQYDFLTALLSALLGGVVFLTVPHKKINELNAKSKYASQKEIINRDRSKISLKIDELATCFMQISNSYQNISGVSMKNSDGAKHVASEVLDSLCANCNRNGECQKLEIQRRAEIEYLAHCAVTKSKTTMLDFGEFISRHCTKKVEILGQINIVAAEVKNQMLRIEEKSKQKEEVARTFRLVSKVLDELSKEASKKISFDSNAQIELSQLLDQSTIFYKELFIYQNENKCICVEMFARAEDCSEILSCIQKIFKFKFQVSTSSQDKITSCEYIIFSQSPEINIEYGYATKPKRQGQPNGDSMTIMNLPNNKFVCAICDGMGSGENANEFSQKTINFIENLFKSGFVACDIIASVNSFMESCEYNSYATLDILEIDLYAQRGYLYKVGSPDTYFKSEKTYLISSKALPIGILKEIKLEINSFKLERGNVIVMSSDGILDYMRSELQSGIKDRNWENSQIFANEIMQMCDKKMKRGDSDDRTIIAIEVV